MQENLDKSNPLLLDIYPDLFSGHYALNFTYGLSTYSSYMKVMSPHKVSLNYHRTKTFRGGACIWPRVLDTAKRMDGSGACACKS